MTPAIPTKELAYNAQAVRASKSFAQALADSLEQSSLLQHQLDQGEATLEKAQKLHESLSRIASQFERIRALKAEIARRRVQ